MQLIVASRKEYLSYFFIVEFLTGITRVWLYLRKILGKNRRVFSGNITGFESKTLSFFIVLQEKVRVRVSLHIFF